ncbi:NAD(P)-dependent oxidoreductase [Microbacterium paludicola]|nr:NAD(P)H-binding protein [Microbacterium paludicola]
MRVAVLGGTGYAGAHVVREVADRGHEVIAVARRLPDDPLDGVTYTAGDVTDEVTLAEIVRSADVVVSALAARADMAGRVAETIRMLAELAAASGTRVAVIAGAGGLRLEAGGPRLIDTPAYPDSGRPMGLEMIDVYEHLRTADEALDWFVICPAQRFTRSNPGVRTGRYRVGGDVLLFDEHGVSDISGADLAVAILDEIERPQHRRERFGVAY